MLRISTVFIVVTVGLSLLVALSHANTPINSGRSLRWRARCPVIELENGRVKIRARGRVAKFRCYKGFIRVEGDRFATCTANTWVGKIPKCIKNGCEIVEAPMNGHREYQFRRAMAVFTCEPGYELMGSPALSCDSTNWNDTTPTCESPPNSSLSCDFENGDCGWVNSNKDDFDWIIKRGPAQQFMAGTGPTADHTLNSDEGHYMYIESSIPRPEGHRALLFSPVYNHSTSVPACFTFFYHLFGTQSGALNLYVKPQHENINFLPPNLQMKGNGDAQWHSYNLNVSTEFPVFQIVFEAMRDESTSDIAIDDVKLGYGDDCLPQTTTTVPTTIITTTTVPTTIITTTTVPTTIITTTTAPTTTINTATIATTTIIETTYITLTTNSSLDYNDTMNFENDTQSDENNTTSSIPNQSLHDIFTTQSDENNTTSNIPDQSHIDILKTSTEIPVNSSTDSITVQPDKPTTPASEPDTSGTTYDTFQNFTQSSFVPQLITTTSVEFHTDDSSISFIPIDLTTEELSSPAITQSSEPDPEAATESNEYPATPTTESNDEYIYSKIVSNVYQVTTESNVHPTTITESSISLSSMTTKSNDIPFITGDISINSSTPKPTTKDSPKYTTKEKTQEGVSERETTETPIQAFNTEASDAWTLSVKNYTTSQATIGRQNTPKPAHTRIDPGLGSMSPVKIIIATFVAVAAVAFIVIAYFVYRKRRRDKLADDADTLHLARDEVQMSDSLSHTYGVGWGQSQGM